MNKKVQISQDVLYQYLTEHGIKLVRIAELIGISEASVNSCFKHHKDAHGNPRSFTRYNIRKLNGAIEQIATELRGYMLTFGSERTFTNQRGKTYDPALIEPMKKIGNMLNLTALVERVLGWNKNKKENTLVSPSSKNYGNITREDADRINAELLAVSGVLSSYEVLADESGTESPAPTVTKREKARKGMEQSFESPQYPWDDTALPLQERSRLWREQNPGGVLMFRVNGGYTVEGDDARLVQEIDSTISPYTNVETGLVTAWMDDEKMSVILPRIIAQDRRVNITNMFGE